MSHEQWEALLDGPNHSSLTAQQQAEAQAHLATCRICQAREAIKSDCSTLFDDEPLPPSFQQGWRQAIRAEADSQGLMAAPQEDAKGRAILRPRFTRWVALAATFLVLLCGTWAMGNFRRQEASRQHMADASMAQPAAQPEDQMAPESFVMSAAPQRAADSTQTASDMEEAQTLQAEGSSAAAPMAPLPQQYSKQAQEAPLQKSQEQSADAVQKAVQQEEVPALNLLLSDLLAFLALAWPYFAGLAALWLILHLSKQRRKKP